MSHMGRMDIAAFVKRIRERYPKIMARLHEGELADAAQDVDEATPSPAALFRRVGV